MTRRRLAQGGIGVMALFAFTSAAPAQGSDSTVQCDGLPVSSVSVVAGRPTFRGPLGWWRRLARSLGLHHETTSEGLVRRFVSLDPGRRCTEFRRSESERILRAQPYLADATVTTTRVGDSVRVDVATVDEVALVAAARLRGSSLRALSVGTLNYAGSGAHIEGRWEQVRGLRNGVGGKLAHYQLFGRPYAIVLEGARHPLGENYSASLSHAFLTDLQRVAWHAGYGTSKDFAHLRRPDRSELIQPVDRTMWNAGGVLRVGPPRRLGLIGGMVLGERLVPRHDFSLVDTLTGRLTPTMNITGVPRYPVYDALSVASVLGVRALTFSRMRGLDALEAEQDVGTGTQVGSMLGLTPGARVPLRDGFAVVDAYVGGRSRRSFVGARAEAESRIDLERGDWRHLVASGRAAWYFKPADRWVSELSLEGAGVWRSMLPLQIPLGDRNGGVRGYARSLESGSQRLLARLEQRVDLGRFPGTRAAHGVEAFVDAGRVWSGDAPFGVTTPIRASVGAGVLAAIPAHSQRTVRAEVAVPLRRSEGARTELRFAVREPMRGFWREPPRIHWARLSAVAEQIFSWP